MEPVVYEEREFVWDDYLEDTKSVAVPATSFKHVSRCSFLRFTKVETRYFVQLSEFIFVVRHSTGIDAQCSCPSSVELLSLYQLKPN